jgi:hypothetical protein
MKMMTQEMKMMTQEMMTREVEVEAELITRELPPLLLLLQLSIIGK